MKSDVNLDLIIKESASLITYKNITNNCDNDNNGFHNTSNKTDGDSDGNSNSNSNNDNHDNGTKKTCIQDGSNTLVNSHYLLSSCFRLDRYKKNILVFGLKLGINIFYMKARTTDLLFSFRPSRFV